MKKALVVLFALVVITIWLMNKEGNDRAEIKEQALSYIIGVVKDSGANTSLDVVFNRCFTGAYDMSLLPGGDAVNLDLLLPCLNTTFVAGELEVVPAAGNPIPFRIVNGEADTLEIQVGPGEMPEWEDEDLAGDDNYSDDDYSDDDYSDDDTGDDY